MYDEYGLVFEIDVVSTMPRRITVCQNSFQSGDAAQCQRGAGLGHFQRLENATAIDVIGVGGRRLR